MARVYSRKFHNGVYMMDYVIDNIEQLKTDYKDISVDLDLSNLSYLNRFLFVSNRIEGTLNEIVALAGIEQKNASRSVLQLKNKGLLFESTKLRRCRITGNMNKVYTSSPEIAMASELFRKIPDNQLNIF